VHHVFQTTTLHVHARFLVQFSLLSLHDSLTSTTWNFLIWHFMEDVNATQRFPFSLSMVWYGMVW